MEIGTAEIAPAHKEKLVAESLARAFGTARETADFHYAGFGLHIHHVPHHIAPEKVLDTELERLRLAQHENFLAVVGQREGDVRARDCHPGEFFHYVLELHIVGLKEFAARGGVVEKVAYRKVGACRGGDR